MATLRIISIFASLALLVGACSAGAEHETTDGMSEVTPSARTEELKVCLDNVLCIQGTRWDATACKCVPDLGDFCISGPGGPCGGFTPNPCMCQAGLKCVPSRIPDVPGRCTRL
ncbi:MAG TPA: hypothetical protein VFQ61_16850 [Polyangiaceae bacterium]|nr:hypothetical protein [Polyangiaceae bacterium]